jgi:hypothetical protein
MKWIHRKVWQFCLALMLVSPFFILLISVGAAENPSTHIVFSDYSGPIVIPSGVHARVIGSEGSNTLEVSSGAEVECRNFIGANVVILAEPTDQFIVYRSGATAYLESFNGTRVRIPATPTPQIMIFSNGSHLLIISQEKMMLGSQEISLNPELVLPPFTDVEEPEIPTITLGDSEDLASKDILPTGDIIVVNQPGNPLHGMEIIVPPGSYNDTRQFQVSSAPVISHTFSEYFNPITPIITVENGNELSNEPLLITIPVNVPENHFAMAFYYNQQEGRLEGLTPVDVGDGYIVSATRRFSDIVVSSISMDQFSGNFDIDSGFRPGYDDWQFTNYGSRLAPGGHCAGQAVSAMWYYYERRLKNSQRPLYGRYDNNDRGYGTLDFWEDDSWGYRLASVVQDELNWSAPTYRILLGYEGYNDHLTWMAFGYAMLMSGGPQFIGISSSGPDPAGHAMVVYRMTQDGLYIADPNYPGDVTGAGLRERIIRYRDGRFVPYNSGPNATAISQGGEIAYDLIGYFPLTRWIDWDRVGARWAELEAGEDVGADIWPTQEIRVLTDGATMTYLPLTDRYSVTRTDTARASYTAVGGNTVDMTGRLFLRFQPRFNNVDVRVYRGTQFVTSGWSHQFVMLELQEGENDFGFYFRSSVNNEDLYSNFQRLIVIYTNDEDPDEKISVPDVVGMTRSDAEQTIERASLATEAETAYDDTVENGRVISQDPAPGTRVDTGSPVRIVISSGPDPGQGSLIAGSFAPHGDGFFNDFVINYNVTGLTASGIEDTVNQAYGTQRRYTLQGFTANTSQLRVSGTASGSNLGGSSQYAGRVTVRIWAGDQSEEQVYPIAVNTSPPYAFDVAVPIPENASNGGFSIEAGMGWPNGFFSIRVLSGGWQR